MEIKDLEFLVSKEKINILNYKMKPKARIIDKYIFMDYSQIHSQTEEKCILAEELGHYYYDAYYTLNSSQLDIERAEYKALKWKTLALIPPKSLLNCFYEGIYNLLDIAEKLDVEPNIVKFAYNYYKENNLLIANEEMLEYSI